MRMNTVDVKSKASLRLRLFCKMKYMHQYKQKKKEKEENILDFVAKINFFLHNALDTYTLCGPMC